MNDKQQKDRRRLTLHPLKFDEVISDVLKIKPERKQETAAKKKKNKKGRSKATP